MSHVSSNSAPSEVGAEHHRGASLDARAGKSNGAASERTRAAAPNRVATRFTIAGQGTALPEHSIGADEALLYAQEHFSRTELEQRQLRALYRMSGVKRRHTVVLEGPEGAENRQPFFSMPKDREDGGPSIRERMQRYEADSLPLALTASSGALAEAEIAADEITHLITVSCSGFAAPGVDIGLIKQLGLRDTVQRTNVGFMGCHGALNGLRVARGFAESDPDARILLCAVELCSLHYHYGWNPERLVANALFADGSAAIVGVATGVDDASAEWSIGGTGSCLIPDSEDAMTWRIGNHGFEMSLSARVPELIGTHLRDWMDRFLDEHGLAIDDVQSWAIHPGGPKILGSVIRALDLPKESVDISREILRQLGNMSSPTLLFILKKLREQQAPRPCVALGFGPGLMAEATLFV